MRKHGCNSIVHPTSRRDFLQSAGNGFGALAAMSLLQQDASTFAATEHHKATATSVIWCFLDGGPSHIDLTDPKPELNRLSGTDYAEDVQFSFVNEASKKLLGSRWKFSQHGQCGMTVSELLPHTAKIADDICLVRSTRTGVNNHGQSIRALNTGRILGGRPTLGS